MLVPKSPADYLPFHVFPIPRAINSGALKGLVLAFPVRVGVKQFFLTKAGFPQPGVSLNYIGRDIDIGKLEGIVFIP